MQVGLKAEFEWVPRSEAASFAVREFKLRAFSSPWHFHPEIELTHIVRSRGRRFVGDHIATFEPGDLVLIGSNLPHFWHNDPPAPGAQQLAHSVVVQFREDCLGSCFFSLPELGAVQRLLARARRGLQFTGGIRDAVAALMSKLPERDGLERVIDLLSILRLLSRTSEVAPLSSEGFAPSLDEWAGARINRAYRYVFDHFGEPFRYEAVAAAAGMSLSAFGHYFKRVTGRTLTDFVNEVRVGHARRRLIETPDTIAEVAFASGFQTLSNFNTRFRALTGLNPGEYRRRFRPS